MTRRHYGIQVSKTRPTSISRDRVGAWSGNPFIWAIVVILIFLGVVLYGVSKIVTDAANTTISPPTTGQATRAP